MERTGFDYCTVKETSPIKRVLFDRCVLTSAVLALLAAAILLYVEFSDLGSTASMLFIISGIFVFFGIILRLRLKLYKKERQLEERNDVLSEQNLQQDELLRYYSRFAAMEEMISIIAVQWKQPLTVLGLYIQDMEDGYLHGETEPARIRDNVQKSMRQITLLADTIDDFRAFFRMDKAKSVFNVVDSVYELMNTVSAVAKLNKIAVITDMENAHVKGYSNEFKQILLNLVNNSIEAITEKPNRGNDEFVRIYNTMDNESVRIFVEDSGGGIPQKVMDRLFLPYYTTKGDKNGSGLGLYMTKMIIEKHMNGTINIESIGGGARVEITLERHNSLPIDNE